jgi:hypothetical protein
MGGILQVYQSRILQKPQPKMYLSEALHQVNSFVDEKHNASDENTTSSMYINWSLP